jgi:glutathione S-transferase
VKLFDLQRSPNCRRVRVLARELALPLELVPTDFASMKQAEYLARNPAGKVPTLVDDDGFVLWESGAILAHLADKKPAAGLFPAEAHARADVLRWLFLLATHVQPWLSLLGQERLIKARSGLPAEPAFIVLAERELARFLPILDAQLADREYLAGGYSIADIATGCSLEDCEARGVELAQYAHLTAWRERLRQRPAWAD